MMSHPNLVKLKEIINTKDHKIIVEELGLKTLQEFLQERIENK